jgi:hypothetical protein
MDPSNHAPNGRALGVNGQALRYNRWSLKNGAKINLARKSPFKEIRIIDHSCYPDFFDKKKISFLSKQ